MSEIDLIDKITQLETKVETQNKEITDLKIKLENLDRKVNPNGIWF